MLFAHHNVRRQSPPATPLALGLSQKSLKLSPAFVSVDLLVEGQRRPAPPALVLGDAINDQTEIPLSPRPCKTVYAGDLRPAATYADAVGQARQDFAAGMPASKANHDEAVTVLPGGNTRSVMNHAPFPVAFASGEGATLTDLDGHGFVDLLGDYTAGLLGHSDQRVLGPVMQALNTIGTSMGGVHPAERKLAALMCARYGLGRCRFCNSGTEANLMAVTCALTWQRVRFEQAAETAAERAAASGGARQVAAAVAPRRKILAFAGGYHGGVLHFKAGPAAWNAPYEYVVAEYNDAAGTEALIEEHKDELALVLIEPMQGSGGCIPGDKSFIRRTLAAARAAGALVVADEVQTSRHGRSGLLHLLGEKADLTSYGKYIGGGFSFGAFGGRTDLMDQFAKDLPHGGTFNNNVATMTAGCAVLGKVFTAELAEQHTARGEAFRGSVAAVLARHRLPMSVSGFGSVMSLHATATAPTDVHAVMRRDEALQELVTKGMLRRGCYFGARGMLNLGLAHTDEQLQYTLRALEETLTEISAAVPAQGSELV